MEEKDSIILSGDGSGSSSHMNTTTDDHSVYLPLYYLAYLSLGFKAQWSLY